MNDTDFHAEQMALFESFNQRLQDYAASPDGATLVELAQQFDVLAANTSQVMDEGPGLIYRLLTIAPQFAQEFPRDLLWYLGQECLHFMPDDEINLFAELDDQRRAADSSGQEFSWSEARAAAKALQ
ncbi:PA2817 family protein [Congregibacter brevis]|uniref:PA2817 family protein n=1 Tax=Congregibacter brevis TaxID=3081201 RepID=A0ABZ0IA61_9GAMM|nr:PA2817 family protein [Congregibacter sp. IMCC45268]